MSTNFFKKSAFSLKYIYLRSCEEISGTFIRRYPGENPALPERRKAAALCNEAAELEVPPETTVESASYF